MAELLANPIKLDCDLEMVSSLGSHKQPFSYTVGDVLPRCVDRTGHVTEVCHCVVIHGCSTEMCSQ